MAKRKDAEPEVRKVEISDQAKAVLLDIIGPLEVSKPAMYETLDRMDIGEVAWMSEAKQKIATSVSRKQKDGTVSLEKSWDMKNCDVIVKQDDGPPEVEKITRVERLT